MSRSASAPVPLTDAQRRLVESVLPLVWASVLRASRGRLTEDQAGEAVALLSVRICSAARRYDPSRGLTFGSYAYGWIKHYLPDAMRRAIDPTCREHEERYLHHAPPTIPLESPLPGTDDLLLHDVLAGTGDTEGEALQRIEAGVLRDACSHLPPRIRQTVELLLADATEEQMGKALGVSRSAVQQRRLRALALLRRSLSPLYPEMVTRKPAVALTPPTARKEALPWNC